MRTIVCYRVAIQPCGVWAKKPDSRVTKSWWPRFPSQTFQLFAPGIEKCQHVYSVWENQRFCWSMVSGIQHISTFSCLKLQSQNSIDRSPATSYGINVLRFAVSRPSKQTSPEFTGVVHLKQSRTLGTSTAMRTKLCQLWRILLSAAAPSMRPLGCGVI